MPPREPVTSFRLLQAAVAWTDDDAQRVASLAPLLSPHFETLIDDVYQAIQRDVHTRPLIGDDPHVIDRFKQALNGWLEDLLSGRYDDAHAERLGRLGEIAAELGVPPLSIAAATSRIGSGLIARLQTEPNLDPASRNAAVLALGRLLDLNRMILENASQAALADKLQRDERLASLGQIAGGIVHELRTPLNVIKTSCYYLLNMRNLPPEKLAEHLERIDRQATTADEIITTLSDFARMPEPATRPLLLATVIDRALDLDPPPAGTTIQREITNPPPRVLADPRQLRIALGNLVRNAYDAMDGQGLLVLAAERAGASVRLHVTDSGPGIPPEALRRIMEPLYSTKARGLGLGLAITRTILERHQGQLEVSSPPGQGATFTLTLPAAGD